MELIYILSDKSFAITFPLAQYEWAVYASFAQDKPEQWLFKNKPLQQNRYAFVLTELLIKRWVL